MRVLKYIFCAIITLCTNTVFAAVCASGQYNDNGVCKTCDIGYFCSNDTKQKCEPGLITSVSGASDVSQCEEPEFSVTTTELTAGTEFSFQMSAKGEFVVDWGDGTAPQTIIRTNTTNTTYSHTYATAGTYTIGLSGQATGYHDETGCGNHTEPFNAGGTADCVVSSTAFWQSAEYIVSISGSLGTIFGQVTSGTLRGPQFYFTFANCTNLTSIPDTLFDGLTTAVPSMFRGTFYGCSSLTQIPEKLFAKIIGSANSLYRYTFMGCISLKNIPEKIFQNQTGAAIAMFYSTFSGCSSLTGIPENLFQNINTTVDSLFYRSFYGCSGLTGTIPEKLFSNVKGVSKYQLFRETFYGCSGLTGYIPYKLFSGITGPRATDDFYYTTYSASGLAKKCPANTYQATINTNPSFNSLDGHAICEVCPTGTVSLAGAGGVEQCKKTLSWDADNGLSPTSATCGYDTYISLPNTPEKTGYTFSGWTLSTE